MPISHAFASTVFLTLAFGPQASRDGHGKVEASLDALERAFAAQPQPEILLSMAAINDAQADNCSASITAYKRFFASCNHCAALSYGTDRFEHVVERCVKDTDEELKLREEVGVAHTRIVSPMPDEEHADVTLKEVEVLIQNARKVNEVEANKLFSEIVDVNWHPSQELLFVLRDRAQHIMSGIRDDVRPGSEWVGCNAEPIQEIGYLTIDTAPWSQIWVNGRRFGETPIAKIPVTTGCATIRAVDADGNAVVRSVTVRPNVVTIVKFNVTSQR